jgi:hypothetical protein
MVDTLLVGVICLVGGFAAGSIVGRARGVSVALAAARSAVHRLLDGLETFGDGKETARIAIEGALEAIDDTFVSDFAPLERDQHG